MREAKHHASKAKIAVAAAAAFALGSSFYVLFGKGKPVEVPATTAVRVFDGDTFETSEKQYIRLSGIDSPEMGRCGSLEAKYELEKLILGRKLYIKALYHIGSRIMGAVYSDEGLVNARMLSSGWAELYDRDDFDSPELKQAGAEAREKKIGLFSDLCTQSSNPKSHQCVIKANITKNNAPTYHVPGCNSYATVDVQLHHGDRWFCTEKQAQTAGFRKAKTCPNGSVYK